MKIGKTEEAKARTRASNFYKKHFPDGDATPEKLENKLYELAGEMRPRSWYELKRFIMFDQYEKGYKKAVSRLEQLSNPMTDGTAEMLKPAQKLVDEPDRCKRVEAADHKKLMDRAVANKDAPLASALFLAKVLGCRPAEMPFIEIRQGKVFIPSAKKVEKGDKGVDRYVNVPHHLLEKIEKAVEHINSQPDGKSGKMELIRSRLKTLHKQTFPRRKKTAPITLYSYRHQLGSDLKAGGMTREEVAYVMGHQSTKSVEQYGNVRNGGGRAIKPAVDAEQIQQVVRSNHSEPPSSDIDYIDGTEGSGGWVTGEIEP